MRSANVLIAGFGGQNQILQSILARRVLELGKYAGERPTRASRAGGPRPRSRHSATALFNCPARWQALQAGLAPGMWRFRAPGGCA